MEVIVCIAIRKTMKKLPESHADKFMLQRVKAGVRRCMATVRNQCHAEGLSITTAVALLAD